MFDINSIYHQIDNEYNYGIRDFELTGGEPSEHTQLREICQYIKNKYHNSKLAIITNGGLYQSDVWDLIDEVLISYHLGKTTVDYDKHIFPNGTTYDKVRKTIDYARIYNVMVRTNTVLGTFNINHIHDIVEDLIEFNPSIVNFLPINLFDQANDMSNYIDYSQLRKKLKVEISFIVNKLHDTLIFTRYMPFCDMEGFEQHIVGHLQHSYDWFDWNVELNGTNLLNITNFSLLGQYGSTTYKSILATRKELYEKNSECLSCKYQLLCDGVEKTKDHSLLKYIIPCRGKIIKDPMFYIGTQTQDFYKKIYA